jgi:protein-S-isoprenylcysteine O-methyltransferase Ste14
MTVFRLIIVALWTIFWIYWIYSAFKSKSNVSPFSLRSLLISRLIIIGVAAVSGIIFSTLPESFRQDYMFKSPPLGVVGLLIFLLGMSVAIWARVIIGKNWGMPMTKKKQPELVTAGIYSYIRHPIYSGLLTMILGSTLIINNSWLIVFVTALIYVIYSALTEEKNLTQEFGKKYLDYKRTTKMFIPYII